MATRKKNSEIEMRVLLQSRRRCCICYGLSKDAEVKQGQIAHLDRDPSNTTEDNLAFLCLAHHDQYDSKTSQSKSFQIAEVKQFRKELETFFGDTTITEEPLKNIESINTGLSINQINSLLSDKPHRCSFCNYSFMLTPKLEPGVNVYIKHAKCPNCGNVDNVTRIYGA